MKILIADDSRVSLRLLERILHTFCPNEILTASDGDEAWELARQHCPSLIIADWVMPGLDGLELCRKIRSSDLPGYVYFILVTAKDDYKDIIEGLDAGADDYITKPYYARELELRVKCGLRVIDLERQLARQNDKLLSLNEKLEELTRIDTLTQLGNRRAFYESVERLHDHADRYGQFYAVLLADLDKFKQYNDTFGHMAGDRALHTVGSVLKASLRGSDEAFRYGGEEFVVLLPHQDIESATEVAERIRQAVCDAQIAHPETGHMTLSIGVACCPANPQDRCRWAEVVDWADQALYKAKAAGRNCSAIYQPAEQSTQPVQQDCPT